eukprot:TRINITY_DN4683_c0_g1_i1.p1 TRINITY_DN4683_c0_g1~~TRINITY_DN4683_c0_g1_i1.p1  ORF type:complete len:193 (-),score=40.30 TRINITY_DN4683_c0_g1_i1:102-680(-)
MEEDEDQNTMDIGEDISTELDHLLGVLSTDTELELLPPGINLTSVQKQQFIKQVTEAGKRVIELLGKCSSEEGFEYIYLQDLEISEILSKEQRYEQMTLWKKVQKYSTQLLKNATQILNEEESKHEMKVENTTFLSALKNAIRNDLSKQENSAVPKTIASVLDLMEQGAVLSNDIEQSIPVRKKGTTKSHKS